METLADIAFEQVTESRIDEIDFDNLGFGNVFSDHMFELKYENDAWQKPVVKPYGPVEIMPSMSALHYGQAVFEGMKAYYVDDSTVHLFRPEKNHQRIVQSCERLCMPAIEKEYFLEGIRSLVKIDKNWIPQKEGQSLYIRPLVSAWDPFISAKPSDTYRFYIMTSPVGAYYADPVSLITAKNYVRAVKGGTGQAKAAGNYAGSFTPTKKAQKMGCDQVLWLDAFEHKYVEEVGTMNIFFIIDDVLVTSPLTGTILPGVTRDSVIRLAKRWDIKVEERKLSIDEVMEAGKNGSLQEVFGSGTATVITPVESIQHEGETVEISKDGRGPVGQKLYDTIYGIQTGKVEDPFGWITEIKV